MPKPSNTALVRISPLLALLPFLRPYRPHAVLALLALTIAASATLALPVAFRYMIDRGFSAASAGHINSVFIALFAVAAILAIATAARFYLVSWLGERVTSDLRSAIYRHVIRMSPAYFETTQTGEVLSRLTTDTTLVQTVIGTSLSMGLRNLLLMAGGLIMLFVTSSSLTGYILATLVFVILPIMLFGRRVRQLSRASQDRIADASAMAGEILNAIPTVQAFNQQAREAQRFEGAVEHAFDSALARIRARSLLTAVVILLVFGAIVFVLWLGAHAVIDGSLTPGELGQFVLYAVVTAGAVGAIAEVWGDIQRAAGATERLMELLTLDSTVQTPGQPQALAATGDGLRLENVSFAYPSRPDTPALHQLNLHIHPGERVALVGPSGAGKTTLFQLLLRFYDPDQGQIKLQGVNLRALALHDLRQHLGVVLQDTVIFAASALENIRYGKPEASDEEVFAAAREAAADEFIQRLPQGYASHLGERGVRLSGGQRQRIAIARAILKNPPILLLDEATSALDAESEQLVQQALERAAAKRTTLVIAHRLATVRQADRILVMDQGRIIAEGTHQTLLQSSPLYARLAALQFGAQAVGHR
ncbi:ABC transporter transmembrane domain-containing protein [Craterilacuibacter sp. RT1T]|uniref:ABC transporter transmembrane domain-containing protein n=1 Tax=Craterilacuibacter sp. RT1T TaxID=2942211 RepID=UPI0020BDD7DB|nr:ABC transporter transmembrane domain-containing protein [Craterilacuibacter sp. RT1T]MCL6262805.1 ABC transporter transmembrane domain-containing protein [Craterilacuibacter sp. RT1T]